MTISNSKAKINDIFKFTNQNFVFCGENIGNISININLPVKKSVLCNNNKKYNNNSHIDYICYMKNLSVYNNYSCDICGNFFFENNKEAFYNNTYIKCVNEEFLYSICYNTYKTCEIKGNETHNNCLKCKDDFIYEMNISNSKYKNCYQNNSLFILNEINDSHFNINLILLSEKYQYDSSDLIIEFTNNNIQIENKTEIIKQIINGIIDEFNKTELEDGKDKKIIDNDKVIILTTTDNQKNNEEKNNITMNLGQCENIIKKIIIYLIIIHYIYYKL